MHNRRKHDGEAHKGWKLVLGHFFHFVTSLALFFMYKYVKGFWIEGFWLLEI
jgi:hypothetical protein